MSGLAFAIGVYLPLATMAALYAGGCVRALAERGAVSRAAEGNPGVLAASGLVAGEGLAGVLVAGLVAGKLVPRSLDPRLSGVAGELAALAAVALIGGFLYRAARAKD